MRRLLALLWLLGATLIGRAEELICLGDFANASGDKESTSWAPASPWYNVFSKPCTARKTGIGLAPIKASGGQSGLGWASEEGFTAAELQFTCVLVATSASRNQRLGVTINGETQVLDLTFPQALTPIDISLTFPEKVTIQELCLTNEKTTGTALIDIQTIAYRTAYAPISVSSAVPTSVNRGDTFYCALEEITGGTYDYVAALWSFNGEAQYPDSNNLFETVAFTAPMEDGIYTIKLDVEDSAGTVATFSYPLEVRPYARAINLSASQISKSGFELAWKLPGGASPEYFRVNIKPQDFEGTRTLTFTPTWHTVEGETTTWELDNPLPLQSLRDGTEVLNAYLTTEEWEGDAFYQLADSTTWTDTIVSGKIIFLPTTDSDVNLRLVTETPPESFTLTITLSPWVVNMTVETGSGERSTSIDGLTAGSTYEVYVTTVYKRDDGTPASYQSSPLTVTTEAIPTFKSYSLSTSSPRITLTWPDDAADLPAQLTFWAEMKKTADLPPGLYLSRVYLTGDDGDVHLDRTKALVLTNTSDAPIALDGSYILRATRERTAAEIAAGKTSPVLAKWDFSLKVEGKATYPYTIPAKSELLIFAQRYTYPDPLPTQPRAITTTAAAVANLTPDYTLTLCHEDLDIHTLTPTLNAVVRLVSDNLNSTETTTVSADDTLPSELLASWVIPNETQCCASRVVYPYNKQARITYSTWMPSETSLLRFWMEGYLFDETGSSQVLTVPLYTRPNAAGYRFRIR